MKWETTRTVDRLRPPIIVIGAGIAGLCTALAAAPRQVLLLSRGSAGSDGATPLAQGGIAAALGADDTPAQHAHDTVIAGAGSNDREAVAELTEQAPAAIAWLQQQGVAFDRNGDGGALSLHLEGGHGHARIAHAGGDCSGQRIAHALTETAKRAAHVRLQSGCDVDALLLRDGRVVGVRARDGNGHAQHIAASAVVLATGGIGALFARSSNPATADGAGLALGLCAGAAGRDLEFVQFHPTALAPSGEAAGPLPLVSEAIRGAGARLCDGNGQPLMAGVDPRGDLAPRDIVARRVWQVHQTGAGTWLDARCIGEGWPQQFPTVFAACQAQGIDPRRDPIPVLPAAHFHMGGLATDLFGRTRVPGLYAVGEVACNGVHGSNRLASNSLLEGVVFGRRLGACLADEPVVPTAAGTEHVIALGPTPDTVGWQRLRELLWQHLGPVRNGSDLDTALAVIAHDPTLAASWPGVLARALLTAARQREHSIGAHFRSDDVRR